MIRNLALFILRKLPAEFSHQVFIWFAKHFVFLLPKFNFEERETVFLGKKVKNFYGVAAGLDKNAECIAGLFKMGFSLVEIGTVTPKPQSGNPKPRVFRLAKEKSILNYMGFPSKGAWEVLDNVKSYKRKENEILGVNIGRNKDGTNQDYVDLIEMFHNVCDYITVNVSSPNTPHLLDNLKNTQMLEDLLELINNFCKKKEITTPIFLKLSPDLTNLKDVYEISCKYKIHGFILTNTTVDKSEAPEQFRNTQMGGISGELLRGKSREMLLEFEKINTHKKPVISAGGVNSNDEGTFRMQNGASFVQVYSGLVWWK